MHTPVVILRAGIAGWFVARDAPNFSMIQMLVLLVLMAAMIAAGIFWALLRDRFAARGDPPDDRDAGAIGPRRSRRTPNEG